MAQIKRYYPCCDCDEESLIMKEHKSGAYVYYQDHVAIVEALQAQIKALSIKQAPY